MGVGGAAQEAAATAAAPSMLVIQRSRMPVSLGRRAATPAEVEVNVMIAQGQGILTERLDHWVDVPARVFPH
ncbi:hypothetical protein GCM10010486_36020 [Nonomuraea roseoviolacea subsp. carminata]